MRWILMAAVLTLAVARPARAHVGSPDVYFEGSAGAYPILVVVRMPRVIPGVAEIEVRSLAPGVQRVRVTPMRISGLGSDLAPVADVAERMPGAADVYRAQIWLMARGAWKVHIAADGDRGPGELSVPVGAVSERTPPMARSLGWLLGALACLLIAGAIAIVGASVREAGNPADVDPSPRTIRRARTAMTCAFAVIVGLLTVGNFWWRAAAADADAAVYKIPRAAATLVAPRTLSVEIGNAIGQRRSDRVVGLNDLVPDHGHLMHLFLVREPGMDVLAHLHPAREGRSRFVQELPSMPGGRYRVFADIVHATGFPETEIGDVTLPQILSGLPSGDDSLTSALSLATGPQTDGAPLTGGARMFWLNPAGTLRAGEPLWLEFRVADSAGRPVADLEPYMGLAGHLVVVRVDWQVFAHLHPSGSPPMAAVELANGPANAHVGHLRDGALVSSKIAFPYGFPEAGYYRLFVQVKRAGRVETGVFDAQVER